MKARLTADVPTASLCRAARDSEDEEYSLPDASREERTFFGAGNFGFLPHLRRHRLG